MEKVLVLIVLFSLFSCEKNDENINLDPKIIGLRLIMIQIYQD